MTHAIAEQLANHIELTAADGSTAANYYDWTAKVWAKGDTVRVYVTSARLPRSSATMGYVEIDADGNIHENWDGGSVARFSAIVASFEITETAPVDNAPATYKVETVNGHDTAEELGEAFQIEYQAREDAEQVASWLPEDLEGTHYEGTKFTVVAA